MLFEGGPADRSTVEPFAQTDPAWPQQPPVEPTTPPAAPAPVAPPAPHSPYPHAAPAPAPPAPPAYPAPAPAPAAPAQPPLAVAPAPAAPVAAPFHEPAPTPVHRVVVRLAGGEQVEVATHDDEAAARAEATALMRYLRDGSGDWPFVAGRFLRPEAIVSVDVAAPPHAGR